MLLFVCIRSAGDWLSMKSINTSYKEKCVVHYTLTIGSILAQILNNDNGVNEMPCCDTNKSLTSIKGTWMPLSWYFTYIASGKYTSIDILFVDLLCVSRRGNSWSWGLWSGNRYRDLWVTAGWHGKYWVYLCGRLPMIVGSLAHIGITERRHEYRDREHGASAYCNSQCCDVRHAVHQRSLSGQTSKRKEMLRTSGDQVAVHDFYPSSSSCRVALDTPTVRFRPFINMDSDPINLTELVYQQWKEQ